MLIIASPSKQLSKFLAVALLLGGGFCAGSNNLRPPFPRLHDGRNKVHLLSERFDSTDGYSSQEEFVDFTLGKGAFIERKADSHSTILADAESHTTHVYRPYSCQGELFPNLPPALLELNQTGKKFGQLSKSIMIDKEGDTHDWYLFGVVALWSEIAWLPKLYSLSEFKSGSATEKRHKWTVIQSGFTVDFYFAEATMGPLQDETDLLLKTISIQSSGGERTTIYVLLLEFELAQEVYRDQLQLPLMYGCRRLGSHLDKQMLTRIKQVERSMEKYHLKLEVSATKVTDQQDWPTDTMSLEFARTPPLDEQMGEFFSAQPLKLRLIHQVSNGADIRTVLDHNLNVKYKIDRRAGTCRMSNLGSLISQDDDQEERVTFRAQFSNGLEWNFTDKMIDYLFYDFDGLELAKLARDEQTDFEVAYFMGSEWNLIGHDRYTRLVRQYSFWPDAAGTAKRVELDSVSVWILDADAKLSEIYHFNVLESNELDGILFAPQKARLFDVSRECYLDNRDVMKYGRDFVWLQLHYPVPDAGQLNRLPQLTSGLEREFYHSIRSKTNIGDLRAPKMEFLFLDGGVGFVMRLLLLDSPPLHLIYDHAEGYLIEPAEGDLIEVAPSLGQCSELCRLHRCEAMSFCQEGFSCVLTRMQDLLGGKMRDAKSCTTYRRPKTFHEQRYYDGRLANVVARLERLGGSDWATQMPAPPEGLTGDDFGAVVDHKIALLRRDYMKSVREFAAKVELEGLSVVRLLWDMMLVLVPNRIEIETDPLPLNQGEQNRLEDDDSEMLAFHKGLHGQRYNYKAFEQLEDYPDRKEGRRFKGIDYEQCRLACLDGRCSSFSHCRQRKECIISDIYDIKASADKYIQADADCVIVQRDFVTKFNRFPGVRPPENSTLQRKAASNPSECAHSCVIETGFNCLAFTFCKETNGASCVYSASRSMEADQMTTEEPSIANNTSIECDHYSRSHLADFARVEFRQIKQQALSEMRTSTYEGRSVEACAEICATELVDCSAFQFCYDPESQQSQQCVMIESPANRNWTKDSVVNRTAGELIFDYSQGCHVHLLRVDSDEAKVRQLALLDPMFEEDKLEKQLESSRSGSLLGFVGIMTVLFFCSSLVFSVLGLAILLTLRRRPGLRSRVDRMRAFLGRY